ncbi:hypothetical protein NE237_025242 [Protea cynaroides]|uniref:BED-type domain-containing protein n=1 Tax=Protea cynaroides TaxID=273540 RepID=A0A9Q0H1I6_9MAGN|nr:hypothetical protein NE237_025242 [Protea cynaroides]
MLGNVPPDLLKKIWWSCKVLCVEPSQRGVYPSEGIGVEVNLGREVEVHSSVQGGRASLLRLQQRRCLLILPACPLWRWASSFSSVQLRRCLFSSVAPLPLESCGKTLALFSSSFSGSLLCKVRVRLCEAQESSPSLTASIPLASPNSLHSQPLRLSISDSQRRHTFVVPQDPNVATATAHHWSLLHGSTTTPCLAAIVGMATPLNELITGDIMEGVSTPNVDDLSDDGPLIMSPDSVEAVSSVPITYGKRKRRSSVWEGFKVIPGDTYDDGKERAECIKCKIVYRADTCINGTDTLRRHLKNFPKQDNKDVKQMMLGNQGKMELRERNIDLNLVRDKITRLIVKRELPLKFVEHEEFRDLLSYICPEYCHISRNTQMAQITSITYVKSSQSRKNKFMDCCKELGISTVKGHHPDACTRWNSIYHMLESAFFYRKAFENLQIKDNNYKNCPNSFQWSRIEKLINFLQPSDEITILLLGFKYPTANLYFFNVWKIHKNLLEDLSVENNFMNDMVVEMKKKFDKNWNEYSLILGIALVFDPRYKFAFVDWAFRKIALLDSLAYDMSLRVKNTLVRLFTAYKTMDAAGIEASTPSFSYTRPAKLEEFSTFDSAMLIDRYGKSQLDYYLEEPKLPFDDKYLSTVASESAFSAGGRVIDKYRRKLLPSNAEALICLRDWMFDIDFRAEPVDDAEDVAMALENVLITDDLPMPANLVASTVPPSK